MARHAKSACGAYATGMSSVHLSVRLFVTFVGCDHIVQQQVEVST